MSQAKLFLLVLSTVFFASCSAEIPRGLDPQTTYPQGYTYNENGTQSPAPQPSGTPVPSSDPTPTPSPGTVEELECNANSNFPCLTFKSGKIYGANLFARQSDGSGVMFGIGKYALLSNSKIDIQKVKGLLCLAAKNGFTYLRTFAANASDGEFISPWDDSAEWIERRNTLLDAGLACGVYIQLVLFDQEGNSWKGGDESVDNAKRIVEQYLLKGLDPKSARGRILLLEHANEPYSGYWNPQKASELDNWLESKGWKNTVVNAENKDTDISRWTSSDKLEIHFDEDIDGQIAYLKSVKDSKAVGISTDGTSMPKFEEDFWDEYFSTIISNRVSVELYLNSNFSNPFDLSAKVSLPNGWSGTIGDYLRRIREATGK